MGLFLINCHVCIDAFYYTQVKSFDSLLHFNEEVYADRKSQKGFHAGHMLFMYAAFCHLNAICSATDRGAQF